MDVKLPDGTIIRGVPDGMSKADLTAKLASNGYDIKKLSPALSPADQIPLPPGAKEQMRIEAANRPPEADKSSAFERVGGVVEPVLSIGSGIAGGLVAPIGGFIKTLFNGKDPEKNAGDIAQSMTYQPRTQTGQDRVSAIGNALNDSGIIGIPIPELNMLGRTVSSGAKAVKGLAVPNALAMEAQDAAQAVGSNKLIDLVRKPQSTMTGGGAADTAAETLRTQRAASMPAPIPLTRGQASRAFDQVQFEREAAKMPEGKAINDRYAQQNQLMGQNMDTFADQTGAQASGSRAAGRAVVDALEAKKSVKKAEIRSAYDAAAKAGDMAETVDAKPLLDYVEKNRSALKNAPILSSIEDEVNRLSAGTGKLSINDMEELRKMTGRLAQPGTPNSVYGGDAIRIIDQSTDGKGGPLYQQARRMYENYSNEFTNRDVVDKLLRNKPGTKDRAVAYEDVFNHSILNGSLDDVRHLRRVLQTSGDDGAQAWKELQGQTIQNLKDQMFSNSGADTMGNAVGSSAKLERLVREMDKDGKLDFIFGKQGAQQIRDAKDLAIDLYTSPAGTVNSSNTSSAVVKALDQAAKLGGGIPVVGHVVKYAAKKAESNAISKKVNNALNYQPEK